MSKLFDENDEPMLRELIGDLLTFGGSAWAIIIGVLAVLMPDSILMDEVLILGAPWEFWLIPFVIGVIMAMAGIALMAWDRG